MPCTCLNPKPVFTFYCTVVCTNCGIETNSQIISPSDDTTYNSGQCKPLNNRLYNRPDRWKSLVRKVVGIHSGPPRHDPVWNYLKTYNDTTPISTVSDIYIPLCAYLNSNISTISALMLLVNASLNIILPQSVNQSSLKNT